MPKYIYLWHNGQVMAFDMDGKQMPDWQDHWTVIIPKLLEAKWEGDIHFGPWRPQ